MRKVVLNLDDVLILSVESRSKVHEIDLDFVETSETDDGLDNRLRGIRSIETADCTRLKYPSDIGFRNSIVAL